MGEGRIEVIVDMTEQTAELRAFSEVKHSCKQLTVTVIVIENSYPCNHEKARKPRIIR